MDQKRFASLLVSMGLTAGLLAAPAAAFSDTHGHWAESAISKWSETYHIINGYDDGTFQPDHSISRGAFAVGYNKFNLPQLKKYPIWFPEYKSAASERLYPAFYYQPDIWQFSSSCSIQGIGGRVDANIKFLR